MTEDLRDSAYPSLVPIDEAVAPLPAPQDAAATLEAELTARTARLKRRASALLEGAEAG